jgi:hypothetical protein
VPTALSNDGFASPGASLKVAGKRTSCPANIPFGVVLDTEGTVRDSRGVQADLLHLQPEQLAGRRLRAVMPPGVLVAPTTRCNHASQVATCRDAAQARRVQRRRRDDCATSHLHHDES